MTSWPQGEIRDVLDDLDAVRAYEDAASAVGRLDASARLAPAGFARLLTVRCAATPFRASHDRMIALLRPDGEGEPELRAFAEALRLGAGRAKGGAPPTVVALHEALGMAPPAGDPAAVDAFLRDAHQRTPPVLKAVLAEQGVRAMLPEKADPREREQLAALVVALVLCLGEHRLEVGEAAALRVPYSVGHVAAHDGVVGSRLGRDDACCNGQLQR